MKRAADLSTAFYEILMDIGLQCVHQWLEDYDKEEGDSQTTKEVEKEVEPEFKGPRQSEILRLILQFPELLR